MSLKNLNNMFEANMAYGFSVLLAIVFLVLGAINYMADSLLGNWFGISTLGQMVFGAVLFFLLFSLYPYFVMKEGMDKTFAVILTWVFAIFIVVGLHLLLPAVFLMSKVKDDFYDPTYISRIPPMSESNWAGVGKFCCWTLVIAVLLASLAFLLLGINIIWPW
jgi:hypothetical protein